MIRNKKGFSLVELIIAIAILAILGAVFAPSLMSSFQSSKEKADLAAIENLELTLQTGAQNSNIYKEAQELARKTDEDCITLVYTVDENNMLTCGECHVVIDHVLITDDVTVAEGEQHSLAEFKSKILSYVGGSIEPIEMTSDQYRNQEYRFILTFPDVEFKVESEVVITTVEN